MWRDRNHRPTFADAFRIALAITCMFAALRTLVAKPLLDGATNSVADLGVITIVRIEVVVDGWRIGSDQH